MGRKKGGKNGDSVHRAHKIAEKVLIEGKSVTKAAEEMGIHKNTASRLLHTVMDDVEVKERIQRSRERIIRMLTLADEAYLRVLTYDHPDNYGNQLKAAQSIYRTMGVLTDDPLIKVQHVTPIVVKVENRTYTIGTDHGNQPPPETR